MSQPHDYKHLESDCKIRIPIDDYDLAMIICKNNYGLHRILAHVADIYEKIGPDNGVYVNRAKLIRELITRL